MKVDTSIEGVAETIAYFNGVNVKLTVYAGNTVEACCRRIVARAKTLVRVKTGQLRDSITYAMRGETLGVVGLEPPGSTYWYLIEFGTVYAPAHPFMRPAAEPEASQFSIQMSDAVTRAVAYEAAYANYEALRGE